MPATKRACADMEAQTTMEKQKEVRRMNWKMLAIRALPLVVFAAVALVHIIVMGWPIRNDL